MEEDIKAYVIWGLGSFARVSGNQMMLFVTIMAVIIPLSFLLIKPLNLLMLGDGYARNLGVEYQPGPGVGDYLCRGVDGNRDGVLRADYFPWVGGTSLMPGNFPDIRSPGADAGLDARRGIAGIALQLDCPLAGIRGCATREFRDGIGGCARGSVGVV